MTGSFEAAGDAMTGAIVGRAIEPRAGEGDLGGHAAGERCANCGTPLLGPHCHRCGQHAHIHRTIGGIGHELAHGVFHFEGKIWRTLPLLFLRPGELTRRYVHGERARFVTPLALFLFAVFLTFAVFEVMGPPTEGSGVNVNVGTPLQESRAELTVLERKRADALRQGQATAALDRRIAEKQRDVRGLETADKFIGAKTDKVDTSNININLGSEAFNGRVREAMSNPKLLFYKLQATAYKFAWAVIVLSLPFMWSAFFWRRDIHLYDHAVFVTYSLSFVMILIVIGALVSSVVHIGIMWFLALFPVHLFVQLRGAYDLGVVGTAVRTVYLLIAAILVLVMFAVLLLALGVMG